MNSYPLLQMTTTIKKIVFIVAAFCFFSQAHAQNEHIALERINAEEFRVRSTNGIPFTVVLENSNNNGQYQLASNTELTFKFDDVTRQSMIKIVFDRAAYQTMEDKIILQYRSDVEWIKSQLDITDDQSKLFPTRPIFDDRSLEALKSKVFQYTTTSTKENAFNKWIERVNYSYGAVLFLRELYAASNGENNPQSRNFESINVYEALRM